MIKYFLKKIVLFHHQDIDDMVSYPLYYNHFLKVKNNYNHICLADFISFGLINETGVSPERVFTVFQPLVFNEGYYSGKERKFAYRYWQ